MNPPSSSSSDLSVILIENCQICGKAGHGNHFGAVTCRACAAFFRRFGIENNFKQCKKKNKCKIPNKGWFNCKSCRLKKCKDIGMTIDNFQFGRDSYFHKEGKFKKLKQLEKIPPTMDTFLGRSNLIIFTARQSNSDRKKKYFIDLQFLLDKTQKILEKGAETSIHADNPLEKLALGLEQARIPKPSSTKVITKFGRDDVFALWEDELLKVAKWLTYFDDFRKLPNQLQLQIVKGTWKTFSRLEKLASTAVARREKLCDDTMIMAYVEKDLVFCDLQKLEVDLSWCTKYTFEQLKFFDAHDHIKQMETLIQPMLDLQPTDVELSYMLCQLCFHQVGKLHQGVILQVTDQFQETLSNNLHDYYMKNFGSKNYAARIANMMKINNMIEKFVYHDRVKSELMRVFDIFYVKYSHPDLFVNS